MRILITTIPHNEQRYDTLGDWVLDREGLVITVSETGDDRMNFLIALHEMIEAELCIERGIPEPTVAAFDMANPDLTDPGSDPRAPYHHEHMFAELIERTVALQLDVDWRLYEEACERTWSEGR